MAKRKKILVHVWEQLKKLLEKEIDAACLKRDAYLDRVFKHEAAMLDKEVGVANSREAHRHLTKHFADLDRQPVNFQLSEETVEAMNDVCQRKNIPRDCFVNRVLFFLLSSPRVFNRILGIDCARYLDQVTSGYSLSNYGDDLRLEFDSVLHDFLGGNLSAISDLVSGDPFWAIRRCIEIAKATDVPECEPLHKAYIQRDLLKTKEEKPKSLLGLNCYLEEDMILLTPVPGDKEAVKKLDELFADDDL